MDKELVINQNVKIIPFDEGLEFSSEFDLIDNLSEKIGIELQIDIEAKRKLTEAQREKVGLSILQIENVPANNENELFKKVDPYVENLAFVLSMLKNAYIEIFLSFPSEIWEPETPFDIEPPEISTFLRLKYRSVDYDKRVEIVDHDSIELYLQSLPFHQIIEENPVLKLSKGLFYEYLGEQNREMRFLRLWLILEFQAESKISPELWEKKKVHIKEKVRELLENHKIRTEKVDGEKDLIDLMHRMRNCIVHYGGCKKHGNTANPCKTKFCRDSNLPLREIIRILRNYVIKIVGKDMRIDFKGV